MPKRKKGKKKRWSDAKFDRCIAHVKASGSGNPYAICTAQMQGRAKKEY